jgi:pyruvate/2-oxoglutarate/acetoin dehydrogenase E1 component
MATLAQTIKSITREHLVNDNGLLFSQCTTAVGWIGGTVPDDIPENKGIIELPTSDVSNSGIVVGAALVGKRPIYVIRYQGFTWFNAAMLVNYAAKSKALWNVPCPVFVRALGMEGSIGPVASNMHHGMIMRMPGIKVVAPMTPKEWKQTWDNYMSSDDPFYCSESRFSFQIDYEMEDSINGSDVTIFAISTGRLNAIIAARELDCNLIHVVHLKPTIFSQNSLDALRKSKFGVVVDSDYSIAGTSRSIAYELMHLTGVPVFALGLDDKTAGFASHTDNVTPTPNEIITFIKQALARAS